MPAKKGHKIPVYNFRADYEKLGFEILPLEKFLKEDQSSKAIPHKLQFYNIVLITEGTGKHIIDFKTYPYKKGTLLFIGKGQVHAWSPTSKSKGYIILFTEAFLYKNQIQFNDLSYAYPYNSILYDPYIDTLKNKDFATLSLLTSLLQQEYTVAENELQEEVLQCLLRVLLLKIQADSKKLEPLNAVGKELFIGFQKLLDKDITTTRNTQDYCNQLNTSYHKLNEVVKQATRKTIKTFIDETLLLHSKRLLADRSKNVNEVSYDLGFDEPSNFIKFFKKYMGKTPKQFADSITKTAS